MITPAYCQTMARYNAWQNNSLVGAADGLSEDARRADRGAFFGSITGTLSHLLWGDTMWMSRFDGWEKPTQSITESFKIAEDWESYKAQRTQADEKIKDWTQRLTDADLTGDLSWYSGAIEAQITKPKALLVMQLFNHQTHHRGQVHAMLTAAGARPDDTDIPFMPEDA